MGIDSRRRSRRRLPGPERGQILVLAAAGMLALFAFVALSTDVGLFLYHNRDAQNDADAAALAGVQELAQRPPATQAAFQVAEDWAANNGAAGQVDWSVDCGASSTGGSIPGGVSSSSSGGEPDTLCVGVRRSSPGLFARVLGIDEFPVVRRAAARLVHSAGAAVCPWALIAKGPRDPGDGTYFGIKTGVVYAIKVEDPSSGNFGVLDLGFTGASGYRDLVESGCAASVVNVFVEGDSIVTGPKPGNIGNPTRQALNEYYRYELSDGTHDSQGYRWCDVVFTPDPLAPGQEGVPIGYNPATDPVREGCGTGAATGKGRWAWIPVIDGFPQGSSDTVQILGIASVYLAGWDRTGPPAKMQLYAIFSTNASFKAKDLIGLSDNPLAPLRIVLVR